MVVKNYINKTMLVALLVLLLSPFTLSTISAEGDDLSNNSLVEDSEELEGNTLVEDESESEEDEGSTGTEVESSEEYDIEESSDGSISASKTSINPLMLGVAVVCALGIIGLLFFGNKKK